MAAAPFFGVWKIIFLNEPPLIRVVLVNRHKYASNCEYEAIWSDFALSPKNSGPLFLKFSFWWRSQVSDGIATLLPSLLTGKALGDLKEWVYLGY